MKMTEGMKSSEFWLILVFVALGVICPILLGEKCPISTETLSIPIAAYVIARGITKRGK